MKALTIYQPWAAALAIRAKLYETRGRRILYRGPIAIHAGLKDVQSVYNALPMDVQVEMSAVLLDKYPMWEAFPHGAVIATAELVECWRIVHHPGADINKAQHIPVGAELDVPKHHPRFGDIIIPTEREMMFGDWSPGRYALEFANMRLLSEPVPARGYQGLWNWEPPEGVAV